MTIITNLNDTTYDNSLPFKMIDSNGINLTATEITAIAAAQAAYIPPPPPIPDLATQLAAVLINNGTIQPTDLNSTTLTAVNTTLQIAGLNTITIAQKV